MPAGGPLEPVQSGATETAAVSAAAARPLSPAARVLRRLWAVGWIATGVMGATVAAMFVSWVV